MVDTSNLISQFYTKIAGADASAEFMNDLVSITVETSLHLPDVATLVLHDPRLTWVDDDRLAPGKTIEIAAKAGAGEQPLFEGEIVEIEPDFGPGTHQLTVRAFDRLHRLARGRHVRSFLNVSDGDLVRKIAQEVGLQAQVGPTSQIHPYVLQHAETNLEFLRARAALLGYLLFVRGKTLHCEPPSTAGTPLEAEWGVTLSAFRPRLTTVQQVNGVTVRGWNPDEREEIVGQARRGRGAPQVGEARDGGEVARVAFGLDAQDLITNRTVRSQAAADQLAQAVADRIAGHFIEAEGTCGGNPALRAGGSLRLSAVGNRFGGTYFVTAATHLYNGHGGYSTQFSVSGHQPATLLDALQAPREAAPATSGLLIGVVTDNQDPQNQGRIKVLFPSLSHDHGSSWARVVAPGAGRKRGLAFLPEVNDEVLVGFEQGDLDHPYILGGLWNALDELPGKVDPPESSGVKKRVICSRAGHTIVFDDTEGAGGITIEDAKGNTITIDNGSGAITIEAVNNATIKAGGNLTLEAQGQVEIKGTGVKIDGGAATVDIKGSIINLN